MARRKKKRKGGKNMIGTAFKLIRLTALVANPVRIATIDASIEDKVTWIVQDFTGFNMSDGSFDLQRLKRGWVPYIMACLTTYGIPKLTSIIRRL